MSSNIKTIKDLQNKPKSIRNICILGHVDHGKTTVTDALVASNGIISKRLIGKMRYLDTREDEQSRGITMKSSAISLLFEHDDLYLINLIDTPGHIDFSSEVSTAVRLCDGAIITIDVVEGVSPQTYAALRQAWTEKIKPVLILNKIDRLILELKQEPLETFIHLQQIIQKVNVITCELFTADILEKDAQITEEADKDSSVLFGLEETDDSQIYFTPERGNVIFASAIDGWAFSLNQFVEMLSAKIGTNKAVLTKTLWGDYYLKSSTKRIMKGAQIKGKKPLFVQLVLDNIFSVYNTVCDTRDKDKIKKIVESLNIKMAARDASHADDRVQLKSLMSNWLPLHTALLKMVVEHLPSPLQLSEERVEMLLSHNMSDFSSLMDETKTLKSDFMKCSSEREAPVIVYVSKMFPVERSTLPEHRQRPLTLEELKTRHEDARKRFYERNQTTEMIVKNKSASTNHFTVDLHTNTSEDQSAELSLNAVNSPEGTANEYTFLAFARVFSGMLKSGQKLLVLGPKYDPLSMAAGISNFKSGDFMESAPESHFSPVIIGDLLLYMGREFEKIDCVPAGNVIAIRGLDNVVLKSATITDSPYCTPFTDIYKHSEAIISVAVEPVNAGDIKEFTHGLKLLNQADPCVRVVVKESGEHVIIAAGEVHLERCIRDMEERYAKVKLHVSSPIVPFRETIVDPPKVDMVNEVIDSVNTKLNMSEASVATSKSSARKKIVTISTANKRCTLEIRCLPLPVGLVDFLDESEDVIKQLKYITKLKCNNVNDDVQISKDLLSSISTFKSKLSSIFSKCDKFWRSCLDKIWSFGPHYCGSNILICNISTYKDNIWSSLQTSGRTVMQSSDIIGIINGFQLATLSGPLCSEPMAGVCFSLEKFIYHDSASQTINLGQKQILSNLSVRTAKNFINPNESENQVKANNENIPILLSKDIDFNFPSDSVDVTNTGGLDISSTITTQVPISNMNDTDVSTTDMTQVPTNYTDVSSTNTTQISTNYADVSSTNTTHLPTKNVNDTDEICEKSHGRPNNMIADDSDPEISGSFDDTTHFNIEHSGVRDGARAADSLQNMAGQLMSCTRIGCHNAFMLQPQRLMCAMYQCEIFSTADVLGKLYAVLGKRNGRVISEELKEGTQLFRVVATIPVIESFGFAEEIRKKTSGLASPQLVFSHWQIIEMDPYWQPSTEEEYLHYGEKADTENQAQLYMKSVRKRKGLPVDEKIVEYAEKQRTLKKNK